MANTKILISSVINNLSNDFSVHGKWYRDEVEKTLDLYLLLCRMDDKQDPLYKEFVEYINSKMKEQILPQDSEYTGRFLISSLLLLSTYFFVERL